MSEPPRPDPDALLAELRDGEPQPLGAALERRVTRGQLKVFLGMCPGVGKTYLMLKEARARRREGVEVLIGVVETHGRAETEALLEGLERVPLKVAEYRGIQVREMDLDTLLARKPPLALVDELAHSNAPGSRHGKRYQDVRELLDAGIDVYTTINIQHLESRVEVVREITGVLVRETVPDSVLDEAREIQLVDVSPDKLRQRLREGKVYLGDTATAATENFFKPGNLTALREMALRFTAEKVDQDLRQFMHSRKISGPWKSNERLLVAAGPSPYSESLIRWTRRTAGMLGCPWLAVHVESNRELSEDETARVTRNLSLVRQLGGEVVMTAGLDLATTILRVAQEENVTQIVLGKSPTNPWQRLVRGPSLADRVMRGSGGIDVHMVRQDTGETARPARLRTTPGARASFARESALGLGVIAAITVLGLVAVDTVGYVSVALGYLLAVVLLALRLDRWPVLVVAVASALTWNFVFIEPRFTFLIHQFHEAMMFFMLLLVGVIVGQLTTRLRRQERMERRRERRTGTLLRFTQALTSSPSTPEALARAQQQVESLFGAPATFLLRSPIHTLETAPAVKTAFEVDPKEHAVAAWAYGNRKPAGRFTDTLAQARGFWLPLFTQTTTLGVMGLELPPAAPPLGTMERDLLESFAAQVALVLEKEHFIQAVQHAELAERSNRLHKTLLDSVSHELKTPLAALETASEGLTGAVKEWRDPDLAGNYASEISMAGRRLQRVVNHLLDVTRLESGQLRAHTEWTDLRELSAEITRDFAELQPKRSLLLELSDDAPLVSTDPGFVSQAVLNLLNNAAQMSHAATPVELAIRVEGGSLILEVRDHGPGIAEADLRRIFDKFYRGADARPGGTGLGLSIVRGFARALHGEVTVRNSPIGIGAIFTLRLPVQILDPQQFPEEFSDHPPSAPPNSALTTDH